MKKISFGQAVSVISNISVLAGILLLAYELRQNQELMQAEARLNRVQMVVDAWRFSAEHADLMALREREKAGEPLTGGEVRRIDSAIMAVFVFLEWTFRELSEDSPEMRQVRTVQRQNWSIAPEYGRVWEERKASFDPAFVEWMEVNVVAPSTQD